MGRYRCWADTARAQLEMGLLIWLLLSAPLLGPQSAGIGMLLCAGQNLVPKFELPPQPCTNASLHRDNFVFAPQNQGSFSTKVLPGARMGSLGGAGNLIGNHQMYVVNSVAIGVNGNVTHSNSMLVSYARNEQGAASGASHEFRVRADNGAVFEQTPVRAAALLLQDAVAERRNVTSLGAYLTGLSTTATALLAGLQAYRYTWSEDFSPETRPRYGFVPSEVSLVDSTLGVVSQRIHEQTDVPAVVNDTTTGVCQFENEPPSETSTIDALDGAVDIGSMVALLTQAIIEINIRIGVLEAATVV